MAMSGRRYKIFVSSRMEEFKTERKEIRDSLNNLFSVFVYELDVLANVSTIEETFVQELTDSELYIGLFGEGYGEFTISEYKAAEERGITRHVYIKKMEDELRDPKLREFLKEIQAVKSGITTVWFKNTSDLVTKIEKSIGDWIPSFEANRGKISGIKEIHENKKYFCDRSDQVTAFSDEDKKQKFNFFIIDGAWGQSHLGLVKRFSIYKSGVDHQMKIIDIEDAPHLERIKKKIQIGLFEQFMETEPKDFSVERLVSLAQDKRMRDVFVPFRIDEEQLHNERVKDVIRWFTTEYCNEKAVPEQGLKFYFFLLIRYDETGRSQKKSIQRRLKKFKEHYFKLEELDNVSIKHLLRWVEKHGIGEGDTECMDIVKTYFNGTSFPMEKAEKGLAKLISHYNNEDPQLMEIKNNS